MEWVETTAKTVEQAKELALDQLHVDQDEAEFEVLETPRPGMFGRTRGEARVRARVRPVQPRPKVERRDRRGGRRPKGGGEGAPAGGSDRSEAHESAGTAPSSSQGGRGGNGESAPRKRSRGRGGSGDRQSSGRSSADAGSSRVSPTNEEPSVNDDVTVEEQAEIVQGFVEGLVDAFGVDAEVETDRIDDDTIEVKVTGDDLGLMVGPRGNTLQAIHDMSRTVVQRQATGNHQGRVRLDIAGYREKRREALARFTEKLADQAKSTGVAQVLEPMSAADRKVVHDTANDIDGVHTTSEGEDERRHVIIVPDQD